MALQGTTELIVEYDKLPIMQLGSQAIERGLRHIFWPCSLGGHRRGGDTINDATDF